MINKAAIHEPAPLPERADVPCVADMVRNDILFFLGHSAIAADIMARKQEGMKKYGTPLQPWNGRDTLNDLYQELLDAANYMRQAMHEGADHGDMLSSRGTEWREKYVALLDTIHFIYGKMHTR